MPTSFEAMHEETRPLALLDEGERQPAPPPSRGAQAVAGGVIAALLVLLLVVL